MTDETCGHPTADDTACEHPACRPDGKCWMHTDHDPASPGQPTKLTKSRQENIAAAVEAGDPLKAAVEEHGITFQTHLNWMERGEDNPESIYGEYFDRLTRALAVDLRSKSRVLWAAAEKTNDTKAMMTIIKNRHPEWWADQDIGEAEGTQEFVFRREVVNEPDH